MELVTKTKPTAEGKAKHLLNQGNDVIRHMKEDKQFANDRKKVITKSKSFLFTLFRLVIIVGICYVIIGPLIGIISKSFFSQEDSYNPMVYLFPIAPTLERYQKAIARLNYWKVLLNALVYVLTLMALQVLVCSMVGYGFARFQFPLKKILFACVVVMIVIPTHTIMLPLYVTFRKFDPLGLVSLFTGGSVSLLKKVTPMYIMTALGCGLRSGLYIYIFNQFFRGLPKEIEEAAFVDGAGMWYTYFRIMLVNAIPSVITVSIFSLVWQYNDTFYAKLFLISPNVAISKKITTLQATIQSVDKVLDPTVAQLYVYAGIVLVILPIILIYIALQKKFIEGVERSGIVG